MLPGEFENYSVRAETALTFCLKGTTTSSVLENFQLSTVSNELVMLRICYREIVVLNDGSYMVISWPFKIIPDLNPNKSICWLPIRTRKPVFRIRIMEDPPESRFAWRMHIRSQKYKN